MYQACIRNVSFRSVLLNIKLYFLKRDCIDAIPDTVHSEPHLSLLYLCYNHEFFFGDRSFICQGVIYSGNGTKREGVLCCCKNDCPSPETGTETALTSGYNPFS